MALLCSINAPPFLEDLLIWCGGHIACCHRLLATSSSGCPLMACRNRALRWYDYAQTPKNEICHGTIIVNTGSITNCGVASNDKMLSWWLLVSSWLSSRFGSDSVFHDKLLVCIFHEDIFHHLYNICVYASVLMKKVLVIETWWHIYVCLSELSHHWYTSWLATCSAANGPHILTQCQLDP